MTKMPCSVIQDLLPLYVDDACSEQSKQLVEEHLQACEGCREQLAAMTETLLLPHFNEDQQKDKQAFQSLAKAWHKTKLFAWIKGVIIATASCAAIVVIYMVLTQWKIIPVPAQNFEVSQIYQLSDGSISYWLKAIDGYAVNLLSQTYDEQGNAYVQAYRPLIKKKETLKYGLHNNVYRIDFNAIHRLDVNLLDWNDDDLNQSFQFNLTDNNDSIRKLSESKLKAVYYGTAENSILIWKEGMDLPAASEELEKYWFDDEQFEKQHPDELSD